MSALTLKLLGPFEARDADGHSVSFATTKAQALLAYLLVEEIQRPGAGRPRGELMALLWPDTLPESAQTNLRQTLYRLRQSLPDVNAPTGEIEPLLMSDRQSVWLNPAARYRLDVAEFEEALREAGRLTGEGQSGEGGSELLARAASLYRGDFLEDVYVPDSEMFENWAAQVRESARRRVLGALEQIADEALAAGDDEKAMEYARRQIAMDNLHESAYGQLMRALASAGRRSDALAEYAKLERLLVDELGVEPAIDIARMAEAIRKGELDRESAPAGDREGAVEPGTFPAGRQAELILLDTVSRFWIQGVLEHSLHGAALIELGKEATPAALAYPWEMVMERPDQPSDQLPAGLPIAQIFDESGGALLILGEPGAGKTTMLLELARAKIVEARKRPEAPLPVVFNLTSWSDHRLPIGEWLVEELNLKYLIPINIGRSWVEAGRLLLLLDGLDETRLEGQAACVYAINAFRQEYGLVQIAICSRTQEYQTLPEKLQLNEAVKLLPLEGRQARAFLQEGGGSLEAVAAMLERDYELEALAQSPLMLSIIALTYGDAGAEELANLESAADRREHLFASYVERMYGRRGRRGDYPPAQTKDYLAWLARSLARQGQTVFLLEQLQPDWLSKALDRWLYTLSTRTAVSLLLAVGFLIGGTPLALGEADIPVPAAGASLLTSLLLGGVLGLAAGLRFWRQSAAGRVARSPSGLWLTLARVFVVGVLAYLVTVLVFQGFGFSFERSSGVGYGNALVFALVFGLRGRKRTVRNDIRPVETIRWSWEGALRGSIPGLVAGVGLGLLDQYVTGDTGQNEVVLIFAALGALMTGLVGGLRRGVVASKARPNEGLRLSLRYGTRVGLAFALAAALVFVLLFSLGMNATVDFGLRLQFALRLGVTLGLMALLWYGGIEVLHHAALRVLLRLEGSIPTRYAAFLDHAVDLIFLRRVGGGYIFVHQLLQHYFAREG